LSRVRDFFFDDFYGELLQVVSNIKKEPEEALIGSILSDELKKIWRNLPNKNQNLKETLIAVDGGVQTSEFSYGEFVAVGRACAIIQEPGKDREIERKVKIYVDKVYDTRDKGFIPSYVRTICEYDAAYSAALKVIEKGGNPIVLMDGSLYFSRFPYAIREYRHHPILLKQLFDSISKLRCFGRDADIPIIAISKDSSVYYLYMELLKTLIKREGNLTLSALVDDASSPMDLWILFDKMNEKEQASLRPYIEKNPFFDSELVEESRVNEGYTMPLNIAPSIYYSRDKTIPAFFNLLDKTLDKDKAKILKESFESFFGCPGVATIYWRPTDKARTFRVDFLSSSLGDFDPWSLKNKNSLMICYDKDNLEKVLNHLSYWYCNDIEYNLPLKQADTLARFDRGLYRSKYEPFIINKLKEAGHVIKGTRRMLREI